MAVIIIDNFKNPMPVTNKVELLVNSTQKTNPNFKYVFEIYVDNGDGTFFNLVADKRVLPSPTDGLGYCDIGEILNAYVISEIGEYDTDEGFAYGLDDPIISFYVDCGEEYSTPLATDPIITYPPSATSSQSQAWKASFNHVSWINRMKFGAAFEPWWLQSPTSNFLTYYKTPKVSISNLGRLSFLTEDAGDLNYVEVITYDSAGAVINTFNIDANLASGTVESLYQTVASAPQSLNNVAPANISLGAQPIITSAVDHYTIQIFNVTPTAISELITYTIEEPCRYEQYRLHFLNRLGGWDAYNFNSRNQITTQMSRKSYSRFENRVDITDGIIRDQQYDGKQDYYVTSRDSLKVRSDYLTYEENEWLKELIQSPQIYLEFLDGEVMNFRPVRMMSKKWDEKITSIDKLFKLELDLEFSNMDRIQRR